MALLLPQARTILKYALFYHGTGHLQKILNIAFREDDSRIRKDYSAENFNVLRQLAYNILKSDKSLKGSFPDKQFKCMLDASYLDFVIANWFC